MGGRGQSSRVSGIPKNKKKKLDSLRKNMREHKEKIKKALQGVPGYDKQSIEHWQAEYNAWDEQAKRLERRYKK